MRFVDGVLEAHGPTLAWLLSLLTLMPGGAAALTLGHVVIARDEWSLCGWTASVQSGSWLTNYATGEPYWKRHVDLQCVQEHGY